MASAIWLGTTSGDYSVTTNWSTGAVPTTGDSVLIQGSVSITAGLNQSAVAIDEFVVDPSYSGTIGSISGYLQIDPDSFDFSGTGKAFIDVGSAAIAPTVRNTATGSTSSPIGLYLKGSAMTTLTVLKGSVGVAALPDETATIATINSLYTTTLASDVTILIAAGTTLTTLNMSGGIVDLRAAATNVTINGGTLTTKGSGAITTMTTQGGTVYPQSTGTITTLAANGGTIDFRRSLAARTVTTTTIAPVGDVNIYADDSVVTFTNNPNPSGLVRMTFVRP